ncbi:hypothetical protein KP509_07G031200 [Ceratopteris richardii]|uniref:AB hydrolase-1 domain-containing protein n=1 Tax=Ceratopteris richardii TaxID=49495 RepID=A0A8T2UFQ0_CERRI|nr:hypothetical protein KP509_07G031200 [Ceratopteris richardii]KAH7432624.1 hypothetical protein KP509_07G031200 [Ceratopteris richardii]
MGSRFSCMLSNDKKPSRKNSWKAPKPMKGSSNSSNANRIFKLEEEVLQLCQQQMRLERSSSMRQPIQASKQGLSRSASARSRQSNDPIVQPLQLLKKQEAALYAETKNIVLVHGGGFGAWCWYKLVASLEEAGFSVHAIDLAGSGIDSTDPNDISTLELYVKPLITYMEKIPEPEKVMLVGHDFGGACISYVMERFPQKIAKSVFVSATMICNGQSASEVFSPEVVTTDDLLSKSQVFVYKNGNTTPTAMEFKRDVLKDLLFNQSPAKDVALACLSIRPMPFAPILEKVSLTPEKYGSIARYYIETTDDHALTAAVQQNMIKLNPPNKVFRLKGSDHSPFLSKPQGLFKILLEISQIKSATQTT